MKNRANPGGAEIGPKKGWAKWRERQHKRLIKPVRSTAAKRLNTPKPDSDPDTSSEGTK